MEKTTCIRKWSETEYEDNEFEKLIVFNDNWGGGQNKIINIVMSHPSEVHRNRVMDLTHHYIVPCLISMACDRAFANIGK